MDIMVLYIILLSFLGIESVLLLFIFWKTPAAPFLKASLFKQSIMYIVGKDKTGIFKPFKKKYGSAVIKSEGIYNLTENSHTLEQKTKIPIYFAFRDFAATLKPEFAGFIQSLKKQGFKISNVDDVQNLIRSSKLDLEKSITVSVPAFETIKLHDLENMFPFNLDPTFIDAQVQGELNKFNKLMRAAPMAVMSIVVLLIVGAVAVFIVQRAFKGQISIEECKAMISTVKATSAAISSTASAVPIVP